MTDNNELSRCPACGALLDTAAGQRKLKCPDCHELPIASSTQHILRLAIDKP
jgi:phage FluMu protein Com